MSREPQRNEGTKGFGADRYVVPLFLCGSLLLSSAEAQRAEPGRTEYLGRPIAQTMHYLGAPWLVRESRDREEEPARLLASLGVKPGQTVCDLGCGNGFYTLRLAELVQPAGRVLAVDIQPEMLQMLGQRAEARSVPNVETIEGAVDDPRLPPAAVDLVLLVDVYHEFSHPPEMLAAIHASLRPAGRVALVEFRAEDPDVPIKPLHKMTQAQCVKEFAANGYKLVGQYDDLPWQHVLFFARDDSPLGRVPLVAWDPAPPAP
ncbi:Ubiquinone/menaquinone biosynthesis C-methyltransferase UbiE [Botrimarina colliarenosi]|uniref:Ubiquinone/menaquinone biosynthesis C-methyltransferase UbiE n=1 Tax=Botrimarina colliarenosi TaxID=2528001 RepID=A0A5C6A9D9_9BACT|nr:class I SAM-dependent methyltransferase [Botrimarina colliarenosi]TWT96056.1 Ubiquinone/menaquinone biosynthesis C-methyltransferase UbiE [Botrimarina colliarenosi]